MISWTIILVVMAPFTLASTNMGKVDLTIVPNVTLELFPNKVTMSCTATGFDQSRIYYMQLKERSQEKAISGVLRRTIGSMGHDVIRVDKSIWAEGYLAMEFAEESHLTVIFTNPTVDQSGDYHCDVFHFDDQNTIQVETGNAQLIVQGIGDVREALEKKEIENDKLRKLVENIPSTSEHQVKECPDSGWMKLCCRCYKYFDERKTWTEAQKACGRHNGRLVEIENQETQSLIKGMYLAEYRFNQRHWIWLGLNDRKKEGTFEWEGGKNVTFTAWEDDEPNARYTEENCVEMYNNGKWNDYTCSRENKYICQVDLC